MEEKPRSRRPYVWVAIGVGIAAVVAAIAVLATTGPNPISVPENEVKSSEVKVFPPGSEPYGKTYAEHSVAWWSMVQNIPPSDNPLFDTTGAKCQVGQNYADIWYASGNAGGETTRECTISASQGIFIPIVTGECSFLEDKSLDTDEKRRACAIAGTKNAIMSLSVDGQDIPNLKDFWAEAPIRNYEFSADNMWGAQPGITDEWSAGYYVILEPLSPGEHVIHWEGAVTTIEGTQLFALEVTYNLTVEEA